VHAGSAALAFEQLSLLVKESAPGREMRVEDIKHLLRQVVDVVVQCARSRSGRRVGEVWWRDAPTS
jgi:type IV secretion system protein VirB11